MVSLKQTNKKFCGSVLTCQNNFKQIYHCKQHVFVCTRFADPLSSEAFYPSVLVTICFSEISLPPLHTWKQGNIFSLSLKGQRKQQQNKTTKWRCFFMSFHRMFLCLSFARLFQLLWPCTGKIVIRDGWTAQTKPQLDIYCYFKNESTLWNQIQFNIHSFWKKVVLTIAVKRTTSATACIVLLELHNSHEATSAGAFVLFFPE